MYTISKQTVQIVLGILLLLSAAAVWSLSMMRPQRSQAFTVSPSCTGTTPVAGCYSEEWTATEVIGNPFGFDMGGDTVYVAGIRTTASTSNGSATVYQAPGHSGGRNGVMKGGLPAIVTKWKVDGQIK